MEQIEAFTDPVHQMPRQKPGYSRQDYGTPLALIQAVEKRFGKISIDLAATAENTKCPAYISPEQDTFKQDWSIFQGLAWLNPEFADIRPYARKCSESTNQIIMLTPASFSGWYEDHCYSNAHTIGLIGRICFEGCHNLFPKSHSRAGERKCGLECLGCAPYPKDCMLTLWNIPGYVARTFSIWNWKKS